MSRDLHPAGSHVRRSHQMLSTPQEGRATMGPTMAECGADLMGIRGHMQLIGITHNKLDGHLMTGLCQQAKKRGWQQCEGLEPVNVCVQKVRVTTKKRKPRRARTTLRPYNRQSLRGMNNAPDNTNEFLFSDRKENREDVKEMTGEDFMSREFTREYEQETRNIQRMGKEDLINEYMVIEKAVSNLEKRLEEVTTREEMKALYGDVGYEWRKGEIHMEPDTAEKIRIFQEEITRLIAENRGLGGENVRLREENDGEERVSSSGESTGGSGDTSDAESMDTGKETDNESKKDDTGYESDRSWGSSKELGTKTVSSTCGS